MILNLAIFTATVAAAKTKAAGNTSILRAIDRAVIEITKAKYWSFADGVLTLISTTSGERYVIDGSHDCPAHSKTCKHHIARLLMVRYTERLASEPAPAEAAKAAPLPAATVRSEAYYQRQRAVNRHCISDRAY